MKKLLFTSLIISFALTACVSEEQKRAEQTKEAAVNFIKEQIDCPSTMQVVAVEQKYRKSFVEIDTLCHIKDIKGKSEKFLGDIMWTRIDAFVIDSLRTKTYNYPSHTICNVTYDASNLFGAMVREQDSVVITQDGKVYSYDDFYGDMRPTPTQRIWAIDYITIPIKEQDIDIDDVYFIDYYTQFRINSWVHSSHFPYSFK